MIAFIATGFSWSGGRKARRGHFITFTVFKFMHHVKSKIFTWCIQRMQNGHRKAVTNFGNSTGKSFSTQMIHACDMHAHDTSNLRDYRIFSFFYLIFVVDFFSRAMLSSIIGLKTVVDRSKTVTNLHHISKHQ